MKKDKLLEEYKELKVSNPQEFVGGQLRLVPYETHYKTHKATDPGHPNSEDYVEDVTTDYYDDEVVTDTTILQRTIIIL